MATTVFNPGSYTVSGISPAQTGIAENFQAGLQANLTRRESQQRIRANEQLMEMRRAQEARTQAEDEYAREQREQERAAVAAYSSVGVPPTGGVSAASPIAPVAPTVPFPPRAGVTPPSTGAAGTPSLFDTMQRFESAGVPTAVSPKGAVGLMQVLPSTAIDPGFGLPSVFDYAQQRGVQVTGRTEADAARLLMDPAIGRGYGEVYMNAMLARYNGDTTAALVAYNAGPGFADRWLAAGADPRRLPDETRNYVANITGAMGGAPVFPAESTVTMPGGVGVNRGLPEPEPQAPTTTPQVPTAAIAELNRISKTRTGYIRGPEARRARQLKRYAESGNRRPVEVIQEELSQVQAELDALPPVTRKEARTGRGESGIRRSDRSALREKADALTEELANERELSEFERRFPTSGNTPGVPTAAGFGAPSPEAARSEAPTTAEEAAPAKNTTYGGLQPNYGMPVQQAFGAAGTEGGASGLYLGAPERVFQDMGAVSRQRQRLQTLANYYQQTNNLEGLVGVTNQIEVLNIEQRYLNGMVAIAGIQQENFGPVQVLLQQRFPGRQLEVRPYTDGTVEIFLDGQSEARMTWGDMATNLRGEYDRGFIAQQQAKAQENARRSQRVFDVETTETARAMADIAVENAKAQREVVVEAAKSARVNPNIAWQRDTTGIGYATYVTPNGSVAQLISVPDYPFEGIGKEPEYGPAILMLMPNGQYSEPVYIAPDGSVRLAE